MKPSTKGVVDVVFCLDASGSMAPCIDGVRRNVGAFLTGLSETSNRTLDCRIDFLAHCCSEAYDVFRMQTLRTRDMELLTALYAANAKPDRFFTTDAAEVRSGLQDVTAYGDEAVLVALDMCLDFPWRPRSTCHRVVALLTDEPLEENANAAAQKALLGQLIDKIHALGVMLFIVGPKSPGFDELAEADKSQFQQVAQTHDGLGSLDYARVLAHIGKSVSVSALQGVGEKPYKRALFGQDTWQAGTKAITGGK